VQIDGFTFIAQIANFVILLLLLYRFLYGPIVRAMDEREAHIASQLEEAEQKRQQAEQEAQDYRQRREELEARREEILTEAEKEAETHRKELFEKARQEAEAAQRHWEEAVQRHKEEFFQELRRRVTRQTDQVMRRALADLADADLEQHVIDVFIERLERLDDDRRETIADSIHDSHGQVVVCSAFHITDESRERLISAINKHILDGDGIEVDYERAPDLVCGIELQTDGRRIAWSVKDYIDQLEENVFHALEQTAQPDEQVRYEQPE
jgi:F-type H+-transporting ATPase subunit b